MTVSFPSISPEAVGQFIYLYEVATSYMGGLLEINTYDQPAVQLGKDARALAGAKVGVIGPKTAEALEPLGIRADLVAEQYVGESLAHALLEAGKAKRVLIPRALEAREALPDLLRAQGVHVDVVAAYRTQQVVDRRAELLELLEHHVDVVTFTSSSTVLALTGLLGPDAAQALRRTTLAAIGPITARTAAEQGLTIDVTADVYTVDGLLDALERYFRSAS